MRLSATRTYLEMTSDPGPVQASSSRDLTFRMLVPGDAGLYRQIYREVGEQHHWIDRREWTDEQIGSHLRRTDLSVWLMSASQEPAGYFELVKTGSSIEIAYFGLRPAFIGGGLGRALLSAAIERAWESGADRVWLHTSTLDHPSALPNYLKRGFTPFRTEDYQLEI